MNSSNKWSHGDSRPSWPHSIAQGLMLFCLWSKNSCLVIILLFCYLIREVWMWLPRTWNLSSWTIILWAEGKNCILCLNNIYIFVASVTCSGFGFPIIRVPCRVWGWMNIFTRSRVRVRVGFSSRVSGTGPRKLHPTPTQPVAIPNILCGAPTLTWSGIYLPILRDEIVVQSLHLSNLLLFAFHTCNLYTFTFLE